MATKKKLLQAAAGTAAAGGGAGALSVENVFSTYLYDGTGSAQVIENGINLGQSNSGGGAYFTGANNNRVNVPASSDFGFGTGDYTIEFFVFKTSDKNYITYYDQRTASQNATTASPFIYSDSGGTLYFYVESTNRISGSGTNVATGAWTHVAVCRSSGSTRMFVNGTQIGSGFADSINYVTPASTWSFGGSIEQNTYNVEGYMSNVRVVKGSALYTSNFTAPTSALTAVSGTVLLALQGDDPFTDNSSSAHSLTASGSAKASTFGPFDAADAGEGGMVWMKRRSSVQDHNIFDTERGAYNRIKPNLTDAQNYQSNGLTSFNSGGWSMLGSGNINDNGHTYTSWTFRKAPKFFDVVTYTGNGTSGRTVSHNLGSVPGCIIVKRTDTTGSWRSYHTSLGATKYIDINSTSAAGTSNTSWADTEPTSTEITLGSSANVNASGGTYVAYLFAHNDGDASFGPDGDADIIKCGTYEGNGGTQDIDLGFEPQWVMIKNIESRSYQAELDWNIFDNMREWANRTSGDNDVLIANGSDAETALARCFPTANGFAFYNDGAYSLNVSGDTYIYIAIRRGPMAVPEDATDVFAIDNGIGSTANPAFDSPFPVDFVIQKDQSGSASFVGSRLIGANYLDATSTSAQADDTGWVYDHMDGYYSGNRETDDYSWMWKRAPSFCDVVAYTGNGTAGRTVSHNLGVAPEMMWVKSRDAAYDWRVYHSSTGATKSLELNNSAAAATNSYIWNDTAPTDSVFSLGTHTNVNKSGDDYIAYLFASLDGVSKVGSYTGDGTTGRVIDCGFSSGARFILIKVTSHTGDWWLFDTERGITTSVARGLRLNTTAAEVPTGSPTQDYHDRIDPSSSGFIVNHTASLGINESGKDYIFYAIA